MAESFLLAKTSLGRVPMRKHVQTTIIFFRFRTALIAKVIISVFYFRNRYRINCLTNLWTFSEFVRFSWTLSELFGKSTNSTLGKRASFSQISQKWRPFSENVRFLYNLVNSWENLQILPLGNVRHFRRIRKNDVLFLKMCVFYWILVNYLKNLQILPLQH